jgi:hypothetical protein
MKLQAAAVTLLLCVSASFSSAQTSSPEESYLGWSAEQAEAAAQSTYQDGKVGSRLTGIDTRMLKTERAQNYKLRATWFTPEVIRASARYAQLRSRLREEETRRLVADAEAAGDTVIVVDIDPNEGSGVIPPDWEAFLQPSHATNPDAAVRGQEHPDLRKLRALQTVTQRNYDYDRFWLVFPLLAENGEPLIPSETTEVELVVRIHNREGAVRWPVPASIRRRAVELSAARKKNSNEKVTAGK